jgi:hypothetical protein
MIDNSNMSFIKKGTNNSYVKSSGIIEKNLLPNLKNANIDPRKLTQYTLSLE